MKVTVVSLEDRKKALDSTAEKLSVSAAEWTEARSRGFVPAYIEQAFTDAMHEYGKASRRYTETRKRLSRG